MEATITTVENAFKKTVQDSIKVPTIWADPNGEFHEDYQYSNVTSTEPGSYGWLADNDAPSCVCAHEPGLLYINGFIKQVGSHVTECGALCPAMSYQKYPFLDELDGIFKYAKNLKILNSTFYRITASILAFGENKVDLILPEDLFWNCPNIEELDSVFLGTRLKTIPSGLLAKCPKLKSVSQLFGGTKVEEIPEDLFKNNPNIKNLHFTFSSTKVEEIPENLFKNNPNIQNFGFAFESTGVKKIPDGLLDQFKDGIKSGDIYIESFVRGTPIEQALSDDLRFRAERNMYLPSFLPEKIQRAMIGQY